MTAPVAPEPTSRGSVRWGLLATGGVARLFARDLVTHGHRITAVGSRTPETARSFAEAFDIPTSHGSYEELVADPDVDVVYVATPHHLHAENARAALSHGKHVLVEKPFTLNAAEAQDVVALARRLGLLVMEAMWTRFLPHMAFVRAAVAAGRIGDVRSLHADHTQRLPSEPTHRLNDPHRGGGALLDLGIYPLSFAHDLLGEPTDVTARAELSPAGVDESVATVLRHGPGVLSTSYSSMRTRGGNRAVVLGTAGRLEIASVWYAPTSVEVRNDRDELLERFEGTVSGRGMQYQAAEVERLIEAGEIASPIMSPAQSVAVMTTLDEVRAAIGVRYPGE